MLITCSEVMQSINYFDANVMLDVWCLMSAENTRAIYNFSQHIFQLKTNTQWLIANLL